MYVVFRINAILNCEIVDFHRSKTCYLTPKDRQNFDAECNVKSFRFQTYLSDKYPN